MPVPRIQNHIGNDGRGHYTAHALSPVNSKWYLRDDIRTSEVHEKDVVTPNAYLLFYKRRAVL